MHRDKLEAALAAPFAGFGETEFYPTLLAKGARLAWGIAEAQAFQDGNKRIAWIISQVFLAVNGVAIQADQEEAADMLIRAGARDEATDERLVSKEEFAEWFISHSIVRKR